MDPTVIFLQSGSLYNVLYTKHDTSCCCIINICITLQTVPRTFHSLLLSYRSGWIPLWFFWQSGSGSLNNVFIYKTWHKLLLYKINICIIIRTYLNISQFITVLQIRMDPTAIFLTVRILSLCHHDPVEYNFDVRIRITV